MRRKNLKRRYKPPTTYEEDMAKEKEIANRARARQYGLTLEELNAMYREQKGCCKICLRHEDETGTLAIDHCHVSEKVRGLLCRACNTGLGFFKDSTNTLLRAIEYLNQ